MNEENRLKQLIDIQNHLDEINIATLKEEFLFRQERFRKMQDILEKRDKYAEELENFWVSVVSNSEYFYIIFGKEEFKEGEDECIPFDWIDFLKVDFLPNFRYRVEINAKENEYFENKKLVKEFSLFEQGDCKWSPIEWKGGKKSLPECPLLRFFSSEDSSDDDDNLNIFQILSDIYINAVYYYMRKEEPEEIKEE